MTGRQKFKKYNSVINILVLFFGIFGKKLNLLFFNLFRWTGGYSGLILRYIFLKNIIKKLGLNVAIHPGVFLLNIKNIEIGNNVSIHPMCYIEGAGGIKIGNNVSIAHSTSLISTNHTWDNESLPIKYNPETFDKIIIEDDVWIGCGVRILSGVKISKRSVVARGAVVNKSFTEKSLIGGLPAKLIKKINDC
ncbi:acyltransferase [Flavobacterium sp. CS20]|uniref:acyltransferase n=1 Tax=Flavobacterium sp. CS20 TaxID=2775246 RepID=UPI001B3A4EA2|nr:acyltransferase [Flavobacterium sp. CS20]QTY26669.1 acyltransferase [Flavobacterium sp. CS20]